MPRFFFIFHLTNLRYSCTRAKTGPVNQLISGVTLCGETHIVQLNTVDGAESPITPVNPMEKMVSAQQHTSKHIGEPTKTTLRQSAGYLLGPGYYE